MDKSSLALLLLALLGPLVSTVLVSSPEAPMPPAQTAPAATTAKLDSLQVPKTSVKAVPNSQTVLVAFTVILKRVIVEPETPIMLTGEWHSQSGFSPLPVLWLDKDGKELPHYSIAADPFLIATARLAVPDKALGPGFLRFTATPQLEANQKPTPQYFESPLKVIADRAVPPLPSGNTKLFTIPAAFAATCLLAGSLVLFWRRSTTTSGAFQFAYLPLHRFIWKIQDSWVANLNAATTIVATLATLGLTADSLSSPGVVKEYSAWSALYLLCAGLAPLVFTLLKIVAAPKGADPVETGSMFGFYLANGFNLFGVGGQLLFAYYALHSLAVTLALDPLAAGCIPFLPALLALATLFYVCMRFQLVAVASTQAKSQPYELTSMF